MLTRDGGGEGRLGPAGRLRSGDLARRASIGCWRAVDGAVARGARVLAGGHAVDALAPGYYMAPTMLENVVARRRAVAAGAVRSGHVPVSRRRTSTRRFALANATAFGLTGAIHTVNSNRIEQFIARYRAGLVSINGPTYGAGPHMPFGGVKNSGNGFREPGTEALDVYCEWKTVVVNHDPGARTDA